jgi:hypothetical protein
VTKPPHSHTLNRDITLAELLQTLKRLQRNKAAGLDGMKVKFILDAGELLHMKGFLKPFPLGWSMRSLKGEIPPKLTITRG